jgi:hypothetical protein
MWIRRNESRSELVPKGVLELRVKNGPYGARSTWRDGKRRRLEGQLSDFVAYLPAIAEALKKQHEAMLERQREYSEMETLRLQDEQRKQEETRRIERLERELGRWRLARDIRDYVAEVRGIITAAGGGIADDKELAESLTWAETTANGIDPLTRLRESTAASLSREARSGPGSVSETANAASALLSRGQAAIGVPRKGGEVETIGPSLRPPIPDTCLE